MGDLKPGWKPVQFGDVVRLNKDKSKDPEADGLERYVGLEHIAPGDLKVRSWGDVSEGTTFTNRFRPGQVLFGKRRAYQRKMAVADFEGVCSGDIYVLEPKDSAVLRPELLPFICQTDSFFQHAVGTSAGSLSPRTNWRSLSTYSFALPPAPKQQGLLDVFVAYDDVVESYRNLHEQASALADSLLLASFGADQGTRPRETLLECVRSSGGARVVQVRDVGHPSEQTAQVGPFGGSLASRHFVEQGTRVLKVLNVGHDGFVDHEQFVFIADRYADTLERYKVAVDDVLIVAQGFTSGRSAIVRQADMPAVISQHLMRVRLDPATVRPGWFWMFCLSALFEEQVLPVMHKTTRPGLNTEDILSLWLPVPALDVQDAYLDAFTSVWATVTSAHARLTDAQDLMRRHANEVFGSSGDHQ